jgi:hypothetical protein
MGEAHRGAPVTVTVGSALDDLTVTASLYQAHAPWLTAVLVTLAMTGLDEARSHAGTRSDHDDLTSGACAPNAGSYGPGGAA